MNIFLTFEAFKILTPPPIINKSLYQPKLCFAEIKCNDVMYHFQFLYMRYIKYNINYP